jgi:hypothetical protein
MRFDAAAEQLEIFPTRKGRTNAWHTSYFGLNLYADRITYHLAADSLTMQIMSGQQLIPMTVESDNYFNSERLRKMNPFYRTHPVSLVVGYARKYGIDTFYDLELAEEYEISLGTVRGELKLLEGYDMIHYDRRTSEVTVMDKAFHYFDASVGEKDFDYLYMEGLVEDGHNAVLHFDEGELKVRGVRSFSVTKDYELEIEPDSTQQVTFLQNRGFRFSGAVTEGDFIYNGKNFEFNYDQFLIDMPEIDSMRLNIPVPDSLREEGIQPDRQELSNSITETSGTLYINAPGNLSGNEEREDFPYFTSNSDAIVYFDGKEILNGAYDRSVFFVLPPFEVDSLDREQGASFAFEGSFNSGGIFPEFEETLTIQPDQSLGFIHQIPPEGYELYGTEARTYEKIRLSNEGIRGGGKIDFLTTEIFSDDFIYYPDSVTANGSGGKIRPGDYKGASYPEAILGPYDMTWLPKKDSMYLRTVDEPFRFYNGTAALEGFANVTTGGVYGGGTMKTRGTITKSAKFNFQELSYSGRNADFIAESDDPEKPAMAGDNISLDFDLTQNEAVLQPEVRGEAAISFPYAQMKTSITKAVWDLDAGLVTMTKPPEVDIMDSYFYSTRESLDSLVFSGEKATYDMSTYQLKVEGIPYITVADSRIIPEGNTTTILENSELQPFLNARVIIDTVNAYHQLNKGQITVISRNKFQGSAFYQVMVESDTFEIRFDSFELQEVPISKKESRLMTVSGGEVPEDQELKIAPGFFYKGSVDMYAYKAALELDGYVKMDVENIDVSDLWIPYTRKDSSIYPHIPLENAVFEDGRQGIAGIHTGIQGDLYSTFVEKYLDDADTDFFRARGELSFDKDSRKYKIESPSKTAGGYAGYTMTYDDSSAEISFEGPVQFLKATTTDINLKSAVIGQGNKRDASFKIDAFIIMNLEVPGALPVIMGDDLLAAVERMGANPANESSEELLIKMANFVGDKNTLKYQEDLLGGYKPLQSVSPELDGTVVISGVRMNWSSSEQAWYSTSKIGLSHTDRVDVNAALDGFLEIRRDDTGADVVNLFLQAAPEAWYYISYHDNSLILYSSNEEFNAIVKDKSNVDSQKPGELLFAPGDLNETLGFINGFRKQYFGIDEAYNLASPTDASLEDENFETIEEEDDDFGF